MEQHRKLPTKKKKKKKKKEKKKTKAAVTKHANTHLQNICADRKDKKELYKSCETTEEEYKR